MTISHADHDHPNTSAARAACRRALAGDAPRTPRTRQAKVDAREALPITRAELLARADTLYPNPAAARGAIHALKARDIFDMATAWNAMPVDAKDHDLATSICLQTYAGGAILPTTN
jgi:hypothetical protein